MQDAAATDEFLSLLGSSSFIPALHNYLQSSSVGTLPLDPAILQAILTCIVAGDRNLILHAPEEDVGLVVRLASWTLSTIFDASTHRLKIKPRPTPTPRSLDVGRHTDASTFLHSLFFQPGRNEFSEPSRPPSRNRSGKFRRTEYLRSPSVPPSPKIGPTEGPVSGERRPAHARSFPYVPAVSGQVELPRALIISGLEDASVLDQRELTKVLTERKVVIDAPEPERGCIRRPKFTLSRTQEEDGSSGQELYGTWNLPEGFIMVYVCPWNLRDRPKIHKPLLDHFAMSSTILVKPNVRQAFKALPFHNGHLRTRLYSQTRSTPPTPPTMSPSLPPHIPAIAAPRPIAAHHHPSVYPHPRTPTPIVPKHILPRKFLVLLQATARKAHFSSDLSLYLSDLFSAARHHSQLDGTLLTVRAMDDAVALARAWRVLGQDPTGGELIRSPYKGDMFEGSTHEGDAVDETNERNAKHSGNPATPQPPSEPPMLYVSEADVARIVPRVITHRVRVRDGPEDEILASVVFGATNKPSNGIAGTEGENSGGADGYDGWDRRSTIKDILVKLLTEV